MRGKLQHVEVRVAKTARGDLVKILVNRKSLLKQCLKKACTQSDQDFLYEDITTLLMSIEKIEELLDP